MIIFLLPENEGLTTILFGRFAPWKGFSKRGFFGAVVFSFVLGIGPKGERGYSK
jgi:hypothetical protein